MKDRLRLMGAGLALALCALLAFPLPAHAVTAGGLRLAVAINSRDITKSTGDHPITLDPTQNILLGLTVTNPTSHDVYVNAVRLAGSVGGLTFYSYQVALNMTVAAGTTEGRVVTVNLDGLEKQATGLMRGHVDLLAAHNKGIASVPMVTDVRGSVLSVYSVCGAAIALLAILGFLSAIVGLARHNLPANRFVRAARFGAPAFGAGLFFVFTLSAFRILVPQPSNAVPIILLATVVGFGLGYLTPRPDSVADEDEEDDDELYEEEASRPQGARATVRPQTSL